MEFKFYAINWWGNEIYVNKNNVPIIKLEEGFYSLSDPTDIDSEPYRKLKTEKIKIVNEFT